MINYVSNLPADLRTGGFSAMNASALEALRRSWPVNYAGPVDPPVEVWRKGVSKLERLAALGGEFFFYSRPRLAAIATEAALRCRPEAHLDFFHGFTPWIATRPTRPYIAWSDCTFRDYIDIYHRRADFRATDLARIESAEAAWMQRAASVAFTSAWAAGRAVSDYNLDRSKVSVVGIFGEINLPEADAYAGGRDFAFISTNFAAKGGQVVLAAYRRLRDRYPNAGLTVVGDAPLGLAGEQGVTVAGYLRKEVEAENTRLSAILGSSRAVVHPTRSDITPLTLVEAGYFGCPVVSTRRFAIPEIVEDGTTGLLIDDPADAGALASAMASIIESDSAYAAMRKAAWTKTRREFTRERFEKRLIHCVKSLLNNAIA